MCADMSACQEGKAAYFRGVRSRLHRLRLDRWQELADALARQVRRYDVVEERLLSPRCAVAPVRTV
jgi:hypothetical protein